VASEKIHEVMLEQARVIVGNLLSLRADGAQH
jgi:hypothetical protein